MPAEHESKRTLLRIVYVDSHYAYQSAMLGIPIVPEPRLVTIELTDEQAKAVAPKPVANEGSKHELRESVAQIWLEVSP